MNQDQQTNRIAFEAAAPHHSNAATLARYKRASLRDQAVRAAKELGALVRRVEFEAPAVYGTLHDATRTLEWLSKQLGLEQPTKLIPRNRLQAPEARPQGPLQPDLPRQGELF